jgi:glucose-1-phosphate thymidylyltransferase
MEIAKALILTGRTPHDRPWPSVAIGPKQLVPVANRAILAHNLESLRLAGVLEVTIAAEREAMHPIMSSIGDGAGSGLAVRYVPWTPSTGVDGALGSAREFVGDEPVLVEPADALHRERLHPHIAAFAAHRLDAMSLRLPGEPAPGAYLLSPAAIALLVRRRRHRGGDPLAWLRDAGRPVQVRDSDGCLPCHGGQERLLEGNRRVLEALERRVDPAAYPTSELQGAVVVHPTARVEHSLVRGPAIIGAGSVLSHAYVGPFSSIGEGVKIEGSQVEHSIVFDGAELRHVGARLESSVIGRGARVTRAFALPTAMRLSVGDHAEVTLT